MSYRNGVAAGLATVVAAGVVAVSTATPAQAAGAYGSPNRCTHSTSVGVGWAGTLSATYLSGRWTYVNGKRDSHQHRVYMEQISLVGNEYDREISWITYVDCAN